MQKRLYKLWLVVAVSLFMVACSIVPKQPAYDVYNLMPASVSTVEVAQPWSLKVTTPYTGRLLGGTRIIVQEKGKEQLSAYTGARWSDPAPVLLRNYLVDVLRDSGGFKFVSHDNTRQSTNYRLDSDLSRFNVVYVNGAPIVFVQLDAILVETSSDKVVANKRFHIEQPANGEQVNHIVQAFSIATTQLSDAIALWLLEHQL